MRRNKKIKKEEGEQRAGLRDDDSSGADDAGGVAGRERDTELRRFAVAVLWRGEDVGVKLLYEVLEKEEFRHRVGDLGRHLSATARRLWGVS